MISGIKLPSAPNVSGVSINKVLADLDLLNEKYPSNSFKNLRGVTIEKKMYSGDNYVTTLIEYEIEDLASFDSLNELHDLISEALPDFIKVFRYSNRVLILVYPKFLDYRVNDVYEVLMEEIQRVAVFFIKTFGIEKRDYIIELVRDYVNMCVEYPGK